jgi:drug/metabolite transporter (DMT)-like permease
VNWPLIAAAATGVQVGAALVASEVVVAEVGVGRLAFLRYAIALAVLLAFARNARGPRIARHDLLPVCLTGMAQFGALIVLLNIAVLYTSSARVALVFATLPLMTVLVDRLRTGKMLGRIALSGVGLSVLGVGLLLWRDALSGAASAGDLLGVAAALAATVTGAVCSSFYKPYLMAYGVVRVSAVAMASSLPPLGIVWALETGAQPISGWPLSTFALVALIGLLSGLGYLLWLYALRHMAAGAVTAFLGLSPITAAVLSAAFLGTALGAATGAALACVVAALALVAFSERPRRAARAP